MVEESSNTDTQPDNSNLRRGFILVCLAILLGVFLSLSVIDSDSAETAVTSEVASPTVTIPETSATTRRTITTPAVTTSTTEAVEAETETTETTATTATTTATTASTTASTTATTSSVGVDREAVTVQVFNDAGFVGVAGLATGILSQAGYETETPTDAPAPDQLQTQVLYTSGNERAAADIVELLNAGDAEVERLTTANRPVDDVAGLDVVVVIGRDEQLPR